MTENELPRPLPPTAGRLCEHDLPSSWSDLLPLASPSTLRELRDLWGNYVPHDDRDTEMSEYLNDLVSKLD